MISANTLFTRFGNLFLLAILLWIPVLGKTMEEARWERQAQNVSIVRDDWGIAHVTLSLIHI